MADIVKNNNSITAGDTDADSQSQKHLSINDIGRFQYILQMDREMGMPQSNDGVFRLPPLIPNSSTPSSNSNSINSDHHRIGYWKADSQTPISSSGLPTADSHRHRSTWQSVRQLWKFAIWPMALLLVCCMVAGVVYFLLAGQNFSSNSSHGDYAKRHGHSYEPNAINFLNNYNSINRNNRPDETSRRNDPTLENIHNPSTHADYSTPRAPFTTVKVPTTIRPLISSSPTSFFISTTTTDGISTKTPSVKILTPIVPTSGKPSYENPITDTSTVKNVKIYTNSSPRRKQLQPAPKHTTLLLPTADDDLEENAVERSKLLFPSKETFENFGFTSGHQNSFGVPIEEDERVLRMLNHQLASQNIETNSNQSNDFFLLSITTDANMHQTKVSPTLPNIKKNFATTERIRPLNVTTEDGICQSTQLPICRGILPYDLTNVKMAKSITPQDLEHFQYLIESKCSKRSHQFVCSILEPECRPEKMGLLLPCKRICKAIQEACADIVASSELLTATFDCDIYPNSHDENECKDITRGTKCLKNEFQCKDQTCIPSSWQCDNIKDCPNAEDEVNCSFCEENEFKCIGSDKCIPEKWHCDQYEDCPDASDEQDCELADESQTNEPSIGNARTFPVSNTQNSIVPTRVPDLLILTGDRLKSPKDKPIIKTKLTPISLNDPAKSKVDKDKRNDAKNITATLDDIFETNDDEDDIQGDASGITVPISKSLANFKDSKEIMMTSDSEAEYKYSSSNYVQVKASYVSQCPEGELRCVNGHCITISQLCDKITDCSDGADEASCTYT
ncbi:uncharacterized protein LOC116339738 [Contarinia nasturtii]|uniref:uncharacterized protein LOC116339738 n=1 Tax=Contarinia nasturtii TaxID=265458 RepID=UPI0012D39861|nr:uncharacterized protein LOC116339738 [Contarinia nasturtii]